MDSFHRTDWLSVAQSATTVLAILGAFGVVFVQRAMDRSKAREAEIEAHALTLLSLQEIAAEIAQNCVLGGFQKEHPDHQPIYPDIAEQFESMDACLDRFPIERFIEIGKAEQLRALRRVSLQMARLHREHQDMDGSRFNSMHRNQIGELESYARRVSIKLQDAIEQLCPGKFTDRLRTHL